MEWKDFQEISYRIMPLQYAVLNLSCRCFVLVSFLRALDPRQKCESIKCGMSLYWCNTCNVVGFFHTLESLFYRLLTWKMKLDCGWERHCISVYPVTRECSAPDELSLRRKLIGRLFVHKQLLAYQIGFWNMICQNDKCDAISV